MRICWNGDMRMPEFAYRLHFAGVRKKALKMGGIMYHLYHKEASKAQENMHKKCFEPGEEGAFGSLHKWYRSIFIEHRYMDKTSVEQEQGNGISVVINTYNASCHLQQVLDTVKGFDEVVVCDMESTDDTLILQSVMVAR